jgi:hypothetical protein
MVKTDRPIFLVGIGRSGTTLLRLMLHHHPRIAIPYESHFIVKYHDALAQYGNLAEPDQRGRLVDDLLAEPMLAMWDHEFDRNRVLAEVSEPTLAGVLDALYGEYAAAHGKQRWGDKSDYLERLDVIHELFPCAQFVHIIRDGRDVARSVLKLPWGPDDIIRAAEWWNDHVWVARRMGAILGPSRYLEVRYEALVADPERELRRVCEFLGEDYAPEMLQYHETSASAIPEERRGQHQRVDRAPDPSRASSWRREMHPYDQALFNKFGGRMLNELGYDVPALQVSRIGLGWHVAKLMARRWRSPSSS